MIRQVQIHPTAVKDLKRIHPRHQPGLKQHIMGLGANATPPKSKQMRGRAWRGWYRLKAPPYRIVYTFDAKRVIVWRVFPRGDGYPSEPPVL